MYWFILFRMVDYVSWLCFDTSILSSVGSTLSLCLQDGSDRRQRSLLCIWACLFRNSFDRTESSYLGPKLCTTKERRCVPDEHPKVSNGMLIQFPNNSTYMYWFQPLLASPAVTLKNPTHPVCNASFYLCFHPVTPTFHAIFGHQVFHVTDGIGRQWRSLKSMGKM